MKRQILCICVGLVAGCFGASAQDWEQEWSCNEIEASVGFQVSPNMNSGADLRTDISYGHFFHNGIGVRAGATYTSQMLNLGEAAGVPVAFAWRTFDIDRSYSDDDFDYDDYYEEYEYMLNHDYSDYVKQEVASGILGFLSRIASSVEVDGGVTPGYLWGRSANSFYMTGDLGVRTSWSIGPVNLTAYPAMHYLLTQKINMGKYQRELTSPERWQISLMFGISIML